MSQTASLIFDPEMRNGTTTTTTTTAAIRSSMSSKSISVIGTVETASTSSPPTLMALAVPLSGGGGGGGGGGASTPILSDVFTLYKKNENVRVALFNDRIEFFNVNSRIPVTPAPYLVLHMRDIAGSKIGKSNQKRDEHKAFLTIYAYSPQLSAGLLSSNPPVITPLQSTTTTKTTAAATGEAAAASAEVVFKRKRTLVELECHQMKTHDENAAYVGRWHVQLDYLLKQSNLLNFNAHLVVPTTTLSLSSVQQAPLAQVAADAILNGVKGTAAAAAVEQASSEYALRLIKPLLVFINPKAGSGKAKTIYQEHVVSVWAECNQAHVVVFTQHANHAREHVRTMRLDDYRGIVIISGDGVVYEVFNGLMERADWAQAIRMPVAQLPGGSANAFACCIALLTHEDFRGLSLKAFAPHAAFNTSKAISLPLDLALVQLADGRRVASFLSFEWAIIADVDLESEKYRFLGGMRFAVGAIKRILKLRIYRGRLSFLPADDYRDYKPKNSSIRLLSQHPAPIKCDAEAAIAASETVTSRGNCCCSDYTFRHLAPLDQPVPSDWLAIEENFVLFLVVYLPLISPDFMAAPNSTFNDGHMHLVFIREGISKSELLTLFGHTERGEYISSPYVEYVKAKAFRLEPLPLLSSSSSLSSSSNSSDAHRHQHHQGNMMVDGERVPCGIVQAEMLPSVARVIANAK